MHGRFLRIVLLFWADLFGSMMASFLPEKMHEELLLQVASSAGWLLSEPMFGP